MKLFVLLILSLFLLTGCGKDENNSEYSSKRTSYNSLNTSNSILNNALYQSYYEEEIYQFKTTIYTKTDARQNNLRLSCNSLNGVIIRPNETFSFCNTLGPAKPEDGYQKADTFDTDGDIIQEYGGGKCQVSSTLYNAVKNIPGIEIVERHEHSNYVPYVAEGQDAAVAYGSIDFKFKNNNTYSIKILAEATSDEVIIRIMKII